MGDAAKSAGRLTLDDERVEVIRVFPEVALAPRPGAPHAAAGRGRRPGRRPPPDLPAARLYARAGESVWRVRLSRNPTSGAEDLR